eukprot:CAMPEP_0182836780 /NCGR_PEP_ID=MMETSP0006_2-20121128/22306_1 /TAXON_ID=97485 /ORGANISM="Prymnesium parvum, Strain Texoma1" /LENGTH=141 /DNA_ID=CAMNT_0024965467 /DNA_START=871 /DNA_END=1294 /DNA_ORIENTATION=-
MITRVGVLSSRLEKFMNLLSAPSLYNVRRYQSWPHSAPVSIGKWVRHSATSARVSMEDIHEIGGFVIPRRTHRDGAERQPQLVRKHAMQRVVWVDALAQDNGEACGQFVHRTPVPAARERPMLSSAPLGAARARVGRMVPP